LKHRSRSDSKESLISDSNGITSPTTTTTCFWVEGSVAGIHPVQILVDRRLARSRVSYAFAERAGLPTHIHSIAKQRVKVLIAHDLHVSVSGRTTLQTALVVPDTIEPADVVLGAPWCIQKADSSGRMHLKVIPPPTWWTHRDPEKHPCNPFGRVYAAASIGPLTTRHANRSSLKSNASNGGKEECVACDLRSMSVSPTHLIVPSSPPMSIILPRASVTGSTKNPLSPSLSPQMTRSLSDRGPSSYILPRAHTQPSPSLRPQHSADRILGAKPTARHLWTSFTADEQSDATVVEFRRRPRTTKMEEWESVWAKQRERPVLTPTRLLSSSSNTHIPVPAPRHQYQFLHVAMSQSPVPSFSSIHVPTGSGSQVARMSMNFNMKRNSSSGALSGSAQPWIISPPSWKGRPMSVALVPSSSSSTLFHTTSNSSSSVSSTTSSTSQPQHGSFLGLRFKSKRTALFLSKEGPSHSSNDDMSDASTSRSTHRLSGVFGSSASAERSSSLPRSSGNRGPVSPAKRMSGLFGGGREKEPNGVSSQFT
ncbi:hypothetical protein BC829DRAFT_390089, partial [Chytridium lagenaria]